MTNENLEKCIDSMNEYKFMDNAFNKKISRNVIFSKYWEKLPSGQYSNESCYEMYFISDKNNYVAIVLDMGMDDLHFFVKKEFRKKGYLCNAMNTVILHHIHEKERTVQHLTFENETTKNYCIRNMGFQSTGDLSAKLDLDKIIRKSELKIISNKISENEFDLLKKNIGIAISYLNMCKDQLSQCDIENEDLDEVIHELVWVDDRILDSIEEKQGVIKV